MSEIAIPVENLSKLYHLGAVHQRPDTTSTVLSASLRDALTGFLPRITRISRKGKDNSPNSLNSRQASQVNSSNSPNSWQASGSPDDLWALKDVSFEACPAPPGCYAKRNRRVKRGEVVGTPALASGASVIGRNGAGKSTLVSTRLCAAPRRGNTRLKILSRITEPTSGLPASRAKDTFCA